jgi:hypothetical protein
MVSEAGFSRQALKKPFACFAFGGFVFDVLFVTAWLIDDIIWVYFIHNNPHRL